MRFRLCLIRASWQRTATRPGLPHLPVDLPAHATPATPEDPVDASASHPPAWPSPCVHRVGIFKTFNEATNRFTHVAACAFAFWKLTTPGHPDAASQCYEGDRTPPSTGLQPARSTVVTAYGHDPECTCRAFGSCLPSAEAEGPPRAPFARALALHARPANLGGD